VLLISEVLYDPTGSEPDSEWIEIYNAGPGEASLDAYKLGDEELAGGNEGMYMFPAGSRLAQGRTLIVAHRASAFAAAYGFPPDYELRESDPGVPNLTRYGTWASGSVVLVNSGDEVLLLDAQDEVADAVSWGSSVFAFSPPAQDVGPGHSLERAPAYRDRDQAADWQDQPQPNPGAVDLSTPTPAPTATQPATPTPAATGSPTPGPSPTASAARLHLSEVHYDPAGPEPEGEWVEIYNAGSARVSLDGYKLGDEETRSGREGMYSFPPGAGLPPGSALVVANEASAFQAAYGSMPDFELSDTDPAVPEMLKYGAWASGPVSFGNGGDELLLLDPGDQVVDALSWGSSAFAFNPPAPDVAEGHSLERLPANRDTDSAADWVDQDVPGPGTVRLLAPSPTPTPSPTSTSPGSPTPTPSPGASATPSPTSSLTPTPTAGPSPTAGPTAPPANHLLVSEVFYDSPGSDAAEEWIELYNPTGSQVDLNGYKLGDEEQPGGGEGMYAFPASALLAPGGRIVVALQASGCQALYGFAPDFEITDTDPAVPDLAPYTAWGSGGIALGNTGDEVLLLDALDLPVDVVVYEGGSYPGVAAHPGVASGHSLERVPAGQDTDDCSADFIDQAAPTPGS
jgi:hypothetical protein